MAENPSKYSVTKVTYFSRKSIINRFSKVKSFTINWYRVFKIEKYHFLLHFSKHSICTKVVLSSLNLTDIDQGTKIDHFSIVFFVFNKALVPFVQICAAGKIILWTLECDEQFLKISLQGLPRWLFGTLFKKMNLLKTYFSQAMFSLSLFQTSLIFFPHIFALLLNLWELKRI